MKKGILTNISYNFLIRVLTYVFAFFTLMYVTRVLQPEAFGRISFVSSFVSYFLMFANLGLPIYGMRVCAEKRGDRAELSHAFSELWNISVVLTALSTCSFVIAVMVVPKLRVNSVLFLIYGSSIFFQMIGCDWLFKGLEKFRFLAGVSFACKIISFVCILLFVKSEDSVVTYAILSVMTGYGSGIVCFLALRRYVDISFSFRFNMVHFRHLLTFFVMSLAVSVYSSLDMTMLGFMKGEYEIGLYSLVVSGKTKLAIIGGIVWSSILPLATKLWKDGDRARFEALAVKSLVAVSALQSMVALVCIVFARYIVLFVGGEDYLGAVTSFRILLLSLLPIGASNILGGQVLIPAGKEKRLLEAEIAGAVFNFFSNLVVIPIWSIEGAAWTTVISEVIVWVWCIYAIKKDMRMDMGLGVVKNVIRKLVRKVSRALVKLRSMILGDRLPYYCPCCDRHLKRFVDGGFMKQPKIYDVERYKDMDQLVICPVCRSLPRHRILVSWLDDNIDWIKDAKILHFAQEGSIRRWMDRNGVRATSADLYAPADIKLDIEDTGLPEGSYDLIICNHVLEHVSDYKKALRELYRILNLGGALVISFPVDMKLESVYEDESVVTETDRIRCFGQRDHLRVFGQDSVRILESVGFKVSEINGMDYEGRKIKPIVGPADYDYDVLFRCRK